MVPGTALFVVSSGIAEEPAMPVVNLVVEDENLGDVLMEISEITGYEILLSGAEVDQPISVILNDPLDEALRKVLRRFSYAAVRNEEEKKVVLSIFDDTLASNPANRKSRVEDATGISIYSGDTDSEGWSGFFTPPPPREDSLPSENSRGSFKNELSPSISGKQARFVPTTSTIAD